MGLAKLFLGPQDGAEQQFKGDPPAQLVVVRAYDEAGDPEDLLLDIYDYFAEVIDTEGTWSYYLYNTTERTTDE